MKTDSCELANNKHSNIELGWQRFNDEYVKRALALAIVLSLFLPSSFQYERQ